MTRRILLPPGKLCPRQLVWHPIAAHSRRRALPRVSLVQRCRMCWHQLSFCLRSRLHLPLYPSPLEQSGRESVTSRVHIIQASFKMAGIFCSFATNSGGRGATT